jgi:hypothetical protein
MRLFDLSSNSHAKDVREIIILHQQAVLLTAREILYGPKYAQRDRKHAYSYLKEKLTKSETEEKGEEINADVHFGNLGSTVARFLWTCRMTTAPGKPMSSYFLRS